MKRALRYSEIQLVPKYSNLHSRSEADTSVEFLGHKFDLPIIPANMTSVIDQKQAEWFSANNLFYIMHRFQVNSHEFVKHANENNWRTISISCGVNSDNPEHQQLLKIKAEGLRLDFVTIDVAHSHHIKTQERIAWLREHFPKTKIIAGNIATVEAATALHEWGADAVKAGIGGGSICSTRYQTGFHVPMYTCVQEIAEFAESVDLPVIADGGVQHMGDIAKAINAGATMVMSGGLFASCIDSPAEIIAGKKQYHGSTSFAAKKEYKHIEGITLEIVSDTTIAQRIKDIKMALQSSISYAGGNKLCAIRSCRAVLVAP
jgi:GMP reductase